MIDLPLPKRFDPHLHPTRIVLVGVGGTGGHLARLLARLFVHLRSLHLSVPQLCLIDPDRIEAKNIGRQAFSPSEIGLFKAEVVARRWSHAFGLEVEWINESFDPTRHLLQDAHRVIVIDAVDRASARQALAQACQQRPHLLISCGNHRDAGQVSIGKCGTLTDWHRYTAHLAQRASKLGTSDLLTTLPNAYLLFPDLLQPEGASPEPEASCADLLLRHEQDLFINESIALVAARYVQQVLLRQPIHSFLTFVQLSGMTSIKPIPITFDHLDSYLEGNTPSS